MKNDIMKNDIGLLAPIECGGHLKKIFSGGFFAFVFLLQGCQTLSPDECVSADWRAIGFQDGAKGYESTRIADHMQACQKVGVVPDSSAYNIGRSKGLEAYCTAESGYQAGRSGATYKNVCPNNDRLGAFLQSYQRGRSIYELNQTINSLELQLMSNNNNSYARDEDGDYIRDKNGKKIKSYRRSNDEALTRARIAALRAQIATME